MEEKKTTETEQTAILKKKKLCYSCTWLAEETQQSSGTRDVTAEPPEDWLAKNLGRQLATDAAGLLARAPWVAIWITTNQP